MARRVLTIKDREATEAERCLLQRRFHRLIRALRCLPGGLNLEPYRLLGISKDTCYNIEARDNPPRQLRRETKARIAESVGARIGTEAGRAAIKSVVHELDSPHVDDDVFDALVVGLEGCFREASPVNAAPDSPRLTKRQSVRALPSIPPGSPTPRRVARCLLSSLAGQLKAVAADRLEDLVRCNRAPDEVLQLAPHLEGGQQLTLRRVELAGDKYVVYFELFTAANEVDFDFTMPSLNINLAAAAPIHAQALRAMQGKKAWRFSVRLASMGETCERTTLPLLKDNGLAAAIRTLATVFRIQVIPNYCKETDP